MALVKFPDSFLKMTGGIDQVELKAETVRDLNAKLVSKWPQLSEDLEHSALSIDGYIYRRLYLSLSMKTARCFFFLKLREARRSLSHLLQADWLDSQYPLANLWFVI